MPQQELIFNGIKTETKTVNDRLNPKCQKLKPNHFKQRKIKGHITISNRSKLQSTQMPTLTMKEGEVLIEGDSRVHGRRKEEWIFGELRIIVWIQLKFEFPFPELGKSGIFSQNNKSCQQIAKDKRREPSDPEMKEEEAKRELSSVFLFDHRCYHFVIAERDIARFL